jgi:serine/threonine-protein kinase
MHDESPHDTVIMSLVERALGQPAEERESYVRGACRNDPALFEQVWDYVRQEERMKGFLLDPLFPPLVGDAPTSTIHTCLNPDFHPRFTSGTVLAQRYRIVNLLGRGGMGEVYRADDLLLEHSVAIKFLPPGATVDERAVSRFRNEVRIAREVTHVNVCRVYDIGEAEGLTFLTMEYVDGEDLASLLRRIGKLPSEKALEIARKLCAGLAAAHEKSVIHRDLKPANIMLDGKGHVRITDFGLAGLANQIRDAGSGTPAYMSPEQRAGGNVTPRSDIYALGIVLHELFTGKRPVGDTISSDLEAAVARVIRACLEPDPKMRPTSALAVAAALPGGDPLAAALAAGELPSPELVANAGAVEGMRPWLAVACLAVVIVGLGLLCILRQRRDLINQIPMENSPEVLAVKAKEIAKSFGYTERPVDTVYAWGYDEDYFRFAREQKNPSIDLYAPYPPAVYFWYRQSPHYPINSDLDYEIYSFHRETLEPGMQAVVLDSEGSLLEFEARPRGGTRVGDGAPEFDWSRLFAAAGLDAARFQAASSKETPISVFDTQAAWTGSKEGSTQKLRVEAAAFEGRPVSFRVLGPWAHPGQPPSFSFGAIPAPIFILFVLALPGIAGLLAWRNVRNGRGDRRGAFRLASFLFLFTLLANLLAMHHVRTLAEFALLFAVMRNAVAAGALGWLLYMAFEPQVRKRTPESLISWNRLLAGRFRDPVLGGHLLAGIALGTIARCAMTFLTAEPFDAFVTPILPWSNAGLLWLSFWLLITVIPAGLGVSLLMNLISVPIRRRWLAAVLFVLVMTLVLMPSYSRPSLVTTARLAIWNTILAFTLIRFVVLTTVAALYTAFMIEEFPLTTNWSAWYAPLALLAMTTLVALALYGFVTTLLGRRLWPAKLDAS